MPSSPTRRNRLCTKRNLLLTIPIGTILISALIFFPVYFTRHHRSSSSSSSTPNSDAGNATVSSARARTTAGAVWAQSVNFADLGDLRIEYYSSGQNNSRVLKNGLPGSVWSSNPPHRRRRRGDKVDAERIVSVRPNRALRRQDLTSTTTTTTSSSRTTRSSTTHTNTASRSTTTTTSNTASSTVAASPFPSAAPRKDGSVLEIFYPAHSYTPSASPVGGTQFYALSPFDLSLATSVTFNYSVFFPLYYDFVLGGKLPGLYGGTEGCGGGNKADDCWSSRMAWRSQGVGELYAYLPQDKQNTTAMLQVPPYSYVNSDYGISLGRGSFNLTRGGWTDISQTITLSSNTTNPNGVFDIKVNGQNAVYYDQVYYPTNIKGILFSTFFGGATRDWATPVDQYSYFRGFSVKINAVKRKKS